MFVSKLIGEGKSILNGLQVAFKNVPKQAASKWDKKFALPYMDEIKNNTQKQNWNHLNKPF